MNRPFFIAVAALLVMNAHAQTWTVTNIHPVGASSSYAVGTTGTLQVGSASFGNEVHAAIWAGSAGSFLDLHPTGATNSYLTAIEGSQQVGMAAFGTIRAAAWAGTVTSYLSLHLPGALSSDLYGTSGSQQCGIIGTGAGTEAGIWEGDTASFVNLHPAGASVSKARGTNGARQVGTATFGGADHAVIWTGTAASFVDLHPAGATLSYLEDIEPAQKPDAQMVGGAVFANVPHAGLWAGTSASFVDLHPAQATDSLALETNGSAQVGTARISNFLHAAFWRGTAASFVDLHAFLPADFSSSTAAGIWSDGVTTFVAGYGYNDTTQRTEALLWKLAPSSPQALPTVAIKGKSTRTTAARRLTIRGASTGAERVEVKIAKTRFKSARGTTAWSFRAKLAPGRNRILVRAVNSAGKESPALKLSITRR